MGFDLCLRTSQTLGRDYLIEGACKVGFLTAQLQGHERRTEDTSLRAGNSGQENTALRVPAPTPEPAGPSP